MTPTEERALLELAAKAYGLEYDLDGDHGLLIPKGGLDQMYWLPHRNSGDCFDLSAYLKLDIRHIGPCVRIVSTKKRHVFSIDEIVSDESERPAATRLAVTRAAAEIGRRMQG